MLKFITISLFLLLVGSYQIQAMLRGHTLLHHIIGRKCCSSLTHFSKSFLNKINHEPLTRLLLNDIRDRNNFLRKKMDEEDKIIAQCLQEDVSQLWRYKNSLYWSEKEVQMVAKD